MFVNVINGEKIANVFKKLGVNQVITFVQNIHEAGVIDYHSREYMRLFTVDMIRKLFDEQHFYEAFEKSKNLLEKIGVNQSN